MEMTANLDAADPSLSALELASPKLVRQRILAITEDIVIPHPSHKFPDGHIIVKAETLRLTDMLARICGSRISEICVKHGPKDANLSHTLYLEETDHQDSGEKVLLIRCDALKKKIPETREFAVPMKSEYEPFAQPVWDAWVKNGGKNFCDLSRQEAWLANRVVFAGLGYTVEQQIIFSRDEKGKVLRDRKKKPIIQRVEPPHLKQITNHGERHGREEELEWFQLEDRQITSYFGWSPITMGINPMRSRYGKPKWYSYFQRFLRRPPWA